MWFTNQFTNSIGRVTTSATPIIKNFTPPAGPVGTTVTINGQALGTTTRVLFGSTAAPIKTVSATSVVVKVPAGARSCAITVKTAAGTVTSATVFKVT
jgi:hypothetical protein